MAIKKGMSGIIYIIRIVTIAIIVVIITITTATHTLAHTHEFAAPSGQRYAYNAVFYRRATGV